jgi:hypothetical protein
MATIKTWTFADASVATEFSGGAFADTGNVYEFRNGQSHAKITSHTNVRAYAQDRFGGGTVYSSGVMAVKNWSQDVLWTGGDSTNRLQVLILYKGDTATDFTQAASVYLRPSGKMYVHVSGTGVLSSSGVDSPDTTTTFSAGAAHHLELAWDRAAGTITLAVDGTDTTATISGLTGGTSGIGRVAIGCISDLGATAWTQTVNFYADEMTMDSDKTARPYSGGGTPAPVVPSGLVLTGIDDQKATIQFSTPGGHRIVVKSGYNQPAPTTPTDAGWSTPTPTDGSANPSTTSSGTTTVTIPITANDTGYTAAVFSYNGTAYSASSITTNVFSVAPMAFPSGGLTSTYAVAEIRTNLNGLPWAEFNSTPTWSRGAADVGSFNAHTLGVSGWTLFAPTADFNDTANGTPLSSAGWGTGKSGYRVRYDFTGIAGTPYFTCYHGLDGT